MTSTGKHSFQTLWQEQKILEILLQFLSFFFSSNQRLNKSKRFIYLNFCMRMFVDCCSAVWRLLSPDVQIRTPSREWGGVGDNRRWGPLSKWVRPQTQGKSIFILPDNPVKFWALIWTQLDSNILTLTLTWHWGGPEHDELNKCKIQM